jgi:MinD-like ATPase involved in chromosome partitioning or flagellar assembly
MAKNLRKSRTICVASTKGGVGKTIFTINMAGIFSSIGKKTLLIDLDLTSGAIALALNKTYDKSIYDLQEDLKNNMFEEFKNYVVKYNDNIDILPCPKDPRQAAKIDIRYLSLILDRASFIYDVTLIDTNHILNSNNLYAMDKADEIMFIVTNDAFNLKSMRSFLTILNDLKINKYHILLNNSLNPYKAYFSLYDIKNVIKANVDYTLSSSFYLDNIDKYIMAGKIVTLESSAAREFNKDYATMMLIAADLTKDKKGDKHD